MRLLSRLCRDAGSSPARSSQLLPRCLSSSISSNQSQPTDSTSVHRKILNAGYILKSESANRFYVGSSEDLFSFWLQQDRQVFGVLPLPHIVARNSIALFTVSPSTEEQNFMILSLQIWRQFFPEFRLLDLWSVLLFLGSHTLLTG